MHIDLKTAQPLSRSKTRNQAYTDFLELCRNREGTVYHIICMMQRLMRKEKCHHHFFGNNSLLETAQYLAFFSLQLPHEYNNPEYKNSKLTEENALKIIKLCEKRIAERVPIEYITNEALYLGNKFFVNEDVLVPRSIMNTRFKDFLQNINWQNNQVLDLCAGSGCIGITLALLNPKIKVDLVDVSPAALAVCTININKYSLQDRVRCIQSDLFEHVQHKYDLIITNPPYVSTSEYNQCKAEFKNEPRVALEAGWDGLDLIHKILAAAKNYLNPHGKIIVEVGFSAARRLKRRYRRGSFKWLKYRNPKGKVGFLAMDCILLCDAKKLPGTLSQKSHRHGNLFFRVIDRIKDLF